ncbi:MAG: recombinase family protein [Clostridiales bacterium]|nr:recombinase family protein [Clostridiales bacterium]
MKKAVIYARFSCSSQTEQSIEGQLRVCYEYAKRNDITVVKEYIDRAKSGTNDARPSFQLMMKECVRKQWDYILVYKLDRFSRDKYDSAVHKHTLKQNGIKVISATENIPDTPEAIIFESVLEGFAQYYSAELSQKVKRGLKLSYSKGLFTGGAQLYGYDIVNQKCVINPLEAQVVKKMFEMYKDGYTAEHIANELNAQGYRTKTGKPFYKKMIYKTLCNSKYNGKWENDGTVYTNIYPKIIDDSLWNTVNAIHERNVEAHGDRYNIYDYLLNGLVYCGNCNSPLIGATSTSCTGRKYHYYSCRSTAPYHKGCHNKSIPKEKLEDLVADVLYNSLKNKNIIEKLANALYEYSLKQKKENIVLSMLNTRKKTTQNAIDNMLNAISLGVVTKSTQTKLIELEEELEKIDVAISKEESASEQIISKASVLEFFNRILDVDTDTPETRLKLIRTFIRVIIVYDNEIVIVFNGPDDTKPRGNKLTKKELEEFTEKLKLDSGGNVFKDISAQVDTALPPNTSMFQYCRGFFLLSISNKIGELP